MGLSTETFFMMMLKMMWFRDVVGLVVKGLLFGALPAAICCYEGLVTGRARGRAGRRRHQPARTRRTGWRRRGATPVFRAACLSMRGDSDHELELVHAGVSRGPVLRPDVAAAAAEAVRCRTAAQE